MPFLKASLFVLFLFAMTGVEAKQIAVTILCDNGYPPYSYAENGQAKGLYSDILREAFARMPGYRVEIRPVPWRRGLAALEKGSAFALFPPYHRPVERPYIDYSRPILEERVMVFLRADIARARRVEDFPAAYEGLRIGFNDGFKLVQDPRYQRMLERGQLVESYAKDNRSNLLKLSLGRIDAYINDRLSILWELKRLQSQGSISAQAAAELVEGPTLSVEHGYLGFTNRDNGAFAYKDDFIRDLNSTLDDLERSGVIQQLTSRYTEPGER